LRKTNWMALAATILIAACSEKPKSVDKFNPNAAVSVDIAIAETQIVDKTIEVNGSVQSNDYIDAVSYTHLRAHET
jgi:uncharacterized lipoprotein YajG